MDGIQNIIDKCEEHYEKTEDLAALKDEIRYLKNRLAAIEGWSKRVSESVVMNL